MRRENLFTVEQKRVLVPVGVPCSFGCRYCYTRGGEVGAGHVEPEAILAPFRQFADSTGFETIQFGYDGDPFSQPERGLLMLRQLATLHKHINFSTKAALDDETLANLVEIRGAMEAADTILSALISLSCWESASVVEPHTPSPSARIRSAARLKSIDIPVFLAIRPILPHIPDEEYERIVEEGLRAGCEGFILGPLYADARGQFVRFIPQDVLLRTPGKRGRVSWSPHDLTWKRYEDKQRLQRLMQAIERRGGRVFLSSADAVSQLTMRERAA